MNDHGDVDHGFVVFGQGLVVADAAAVFSDPSEGSLDDPAAGQDAESGDISNSARNALASHCW